jgi:ABC-2 type transport system ATP-binding protein
VSDATIEVTGLRKRFGPAVALDGMTFTVAPGKVTGFVGPNGAGKSTTIRVILGLDTPEEGQALVGGHSYQQLRHPLRHVGALVDAAALQPSRSGPQPPAVDGPIPEDDHEPGRRGDRTGRPH